MSFPWSSPIRRNGKGVALSSIPNEIYDEILDYIQPAPNDKFRREYRSQFRRIALVCRYFCTVSLSRLFETLYFDGSDITPSNSAFCRAITKKDGHARSAANYVRSCQLHRWNVVAAAFSPSKSAFFKLHLSALPHMGNLNALAIVDTLVTPDLLLVLPQLKQLKSVEMTSFKVRDDCDTDHFEGLKALKLTTLRLFGAVTEGTTKLAQAFDYAQLAILATDISSPISKIETSESPLPLHELTVMLANPDFKVASSFFQNLPHLRKFHCGAEAESAFADISLTSSYIPHLEDVCCSWRQLDKFLLGRRIANIEISTSSGPWADDWFTQLSRYSGRVKRLALSCDGFIRFPHGTAEYLANVCYLELELSKSYTSSSRMPEESPHDQALSSVLRKIPWAKVPHLQVVNIRRASIAFFPALHRICLREQHELLERVSAERKQRSPLVIHVGLVAWTSDDKGRWSVEFTPDLCEAVQKMVQTHRLIITADQYLKEYLAPIDYNGYLQSFVKKDDDSDTEPESDGEAGG